MIRYFQKLSKDEKIQKLRGFCDNCWIYIEEPSEKDIIKIAKNYKLDEGTLMDALDSYEMPRLEVEDKIPYIFCRVPYVDNGQATSLPVLIVLHHDFIMTISKEKLDLFDGFSKNKIEFDTVNKKHLLSLLLAEINNQYNKIVTRTSKKIYKAIDNINSIENKDITNLVQYEQISNELLSRMIQLNGVLNILNNGKVIRFEDEDKDEIEDTYLANNQLIDLTKNILQSVRNVRDSYSAILTNNLNRVMKILTIFTVILTIPTMIAGLWGMNVEVPFNDSPYAFLYILGISSAVLVAIFWFLKKKGWF